MIRAKCCDWAHDVVLPTLLFAALGGMTWAVRGSSGFGAVAGCIFAGVTWGAAWWFIAHEPAGEQSRRYASGWVVLALTVGIGLAGARGWMQWPSFFEGRLVTNYAKGEFVPISRVYGFVWLFIAGMPWAGLGACLLAWCGSLRETRVWHWVLRIACGVAGATLARALFDAYPQYFLPLYESISAEYQDLDANPTLKRLINDSGSAIYHLGFYLGFLLFELLRRDWKNVALILTVGVVNGAGWALCQNWKWAPEVWPGANFNWWRCWESSGGISIGIALGVAYASVNRRMTDDELQAVAARRAVAGPNFEWLLVFFGLTALLSLFLRFQMGGWGNIYFSAVILFGLAYYWLNRGTTAVATQPIRWSAPLEPVSKPAAGVYDPADSGQRAHRGRLQSVLKLIPANFEFGSAVLAIALVAGLFVSNRDWLRYSMLYLAIVMACGLAWYWMWRAKFDEERIRTTPGGGDPNLHRLGVYLGLLMGLGLSVRNGLKGWFNIYKGDEDYWSRVLWQYLGPVYLVLLIAILGWILLRPLPRTFRDRLYPHAYALVWVTLVVQNVLAQLVTGPLRQWNEMAFSIYYLLLFVITAVIVFHFQFAKEPAASVAPHSEPIS